MAEATAPEHPRADLLIDLDRTQAALDALAELTHHLVRELGDAIGHTYLAAHPPGFQHSEAEFITYLRKLVENLAEQLNNVAVAVGTFRSAIDQGAQEATL